MHRPLENGPTLATRVVAALAAGLLFALAVLAASPELHERLHGRAPAAVAPAHQGAGHDGAKAAADDEDGCIVTLFSQGVVLAVVLVAMAAAAAAMPACGFPILDRVSPESPRYLRLPTQGPPAGLT